MNWKNWKKGYIISIRHRFAFKSERELKEAFWEINKLLKKFKNETCMEVVNEPDNCYGLFAVINGKRIDAFLTDKQMQEVKKSGGMRKWLENQGIKIINNFK